MKKEMDVGSEHESTFTLLLSAPLCMFIGQSRHISLVLRGTFPSFFLISDHQFSIMPVVSHSLLVSLCGILSIMWIQWGIKSSSL
jgi:hypothetical protein